MKKAVSTILLLTLTFAACIGLVSCMGNTNTNGDNHDGGDTGGDNPPANEPFVVNLAGYVANISNATALGISKNTGSTVSPVAAYDRANSATQLLSISTLSSENNNKNKNYIVMSTTDYDANAPEVDETGLTRVTFTKTVTENVTTEVTGTKVIKAHKDGLSFHAIEGFTYSVYEGDTLVYSDVRDNDENDSNSKIGKILLDDLTDKVDYTVKYSGFGVETTITQDEINGEIDKLYVLNDFTFISFVPEGQSQRPEDNALNYDPDGVAAYDKIGYCSDATRQSFVIDNSTGYVYQIKDVSIEEIKNNLILISGKIYDMRITESDDLEFYTVVQNEKIEIIDFFKDVYGNKYICNNKIETVDYDNDTVYYKPPQQNEGEKYLFSAEGVAVERSALTKITANFVSDVIGAHEKYFFDELCVIRDGYFYDARSFHRVNMLSGEIDGSCSWIFGLCDISYAFLDVDTILLYTKDDCNYLGLKPDCLYYNDLYGEHKITDPQVVLDRLAFEYAVELLSDVEAVNISSCYAPGNYENWLVEKTTLTETTYYKIIKGENGNPQVVDETYIAPEQDVITLQPLNK